MGRLELGLPEMGNDSLSWAAKDLEKRIRAQTPEDLRESVVVRPFKNGEKTGVRIEYDDSAERFVFVAIEYPQGSGKHEDAVPHRGAL
jgi:hypothetical protein